MDAILYLVFVGAIVPVVWWVLTNDAKGNEALSQTPTSVGDKSPALRTSEARQASEPRPGSDQD